MKNLVLVTICSARKKVNACPGLRIRNISPGRMASVLEAWQSALASHPDVVPVASLYGGRGFKLMKGLAGQYGVPLYVVSAGLGLVSLDDRRPVYDLTVSGRGVDSVLSKTVLGSYDAAGWWAGVNQGEYSPISKLIRKNKGAVFVLALAAQYFALVRGDLESLPSEYIENLRIVGIKPQADSPVAKSILPYDDRFNGQSSPMPGTLSDYPQRCAVHYLERVFSGASLVVDRAEVARIMTEMAWPVRGVGKRLSDKELVDLLRVEYGRSGMRKTKMLRHFRDTLKVACEQKRFSNLYDVAIGGNSADNN